MIATASAQTDRAPDLQQIAITVLAQEIDALLDQSQYPRSALAADRETSLPPRSGSSFLSTSSLHA